MTRIASVGTTCSNLHTSEGPARRAARQPGTSMTGPELRAALDDLKMSRQKAYALAKRIGATLEYRRHRWHGGGAQHVDIQFSEGFCFDGNEGLDALHHECELDENIWPGVVADLEAAQ